MKLTNIFDRSIVNCDLLVELYNSMVTTNSRAIRSGFREKVFQSSIVPWSPKDGLWRSNGNSFLILGSQKSRLTHDSFSADSLSVFLRSALVMAMATIDKILHEAISNNFSRLIKDGTLDKYTQIDASKSYDIAINARSGKSTRPGHKIKAEVLHQIYQKSFLSNKRIEEVSSHLGKKQILAKFGRTFTPTKTYKEVYQNWAILYKRRNEIAHECDFVRKAKGQQLTFNKVDPRKAKDDIAWIKKFGKFLARELE